MDPAPVVHSTIPGRLDALPWSRWHWRVVIALGVTWLLDGLEVTVVGALGPVLERPGTLGLSASEVGWTGSAYIAGAVLGALYFGRLADRLGRKRLFLITLAVYLAATVMTALTFDFLSFALCRFLTGFGIGGEYAAINSAIDELIPARVRGVVDLAINGTFWLGALAGAGMSIVLLDPAFVGPETGWRLAFAFGAVLSVAILLVRRHVPESPRWLITHGRHAEAEAVVTGIEAAVRASCPDWPRATAVLPMTVRPPVTWSEIVRLMATRFRARAVVGLTLMAAQAFFYNAIFFTYALIMTRFYGVPDDKVGYYIFPFAIGNFFGPLLLGWLFDSVGRRVMIGATYALSGIGLFAMGYAFAHEMLTATTQTLSLCAILFIASAAASSAYLTVSEIFPVEMRAVSISLFYAIGTGAGGFIAPALFGAIVATGSREALYGGFVFAAILMCAAAVVVAIWGVDAERKPLEEIARPLSCGDQ